MIDISLGGILGASAGIVVAALSYGPMASFIERRMRARERDEEEKTRLEQEIAMMRHGWITFDLLICCGLGYWLGDKIGG